MKIPHLFHCCKRLQQFAFSSLFLVSFLLLSAPTLKAQVLCEPPVTDCDTDAECDDGNPCNGTELCFASGGVDTFASPTCHCASALPPDNTVSCASDGTFCNGTELCVAGLCNGHTGDPCPDTDCNHCNETDDNCFDPSGTACQDDANVCTDDECNGAGTCLNNPNTLPCDDLLNCTTGDICSGGACAGAQVQCDDGISCTLDACFEGSGECQFDNDQCECEVDADCDDQNPCTDETCALNFTCVRSNNSDVCDDGLFCNGSDICGGGTCSIHDGNPCTGGGQCNQTCNETGDNCFDPAGTACVDGDDLTTTECNGGACIVVGTLLVEGTGCSIHPSLAPRPDTSSKLWLNIVQGLR